MHTLNQLIWDTAAEQTAGFENIGDIAIFLDPRNELVTAAVEYLKNHKEARLFIGSRDLLQTFKALDIADDAGVSDRIFAAGYETEIQLDIFFADACAGFNGRIKPAKIGLALSELPKSLAELRYFATSLGVAKTAFTAQEAEMTPLVFVAGGNNKYLSRQQNQVLAEVFTEVFASRGKGKFRCLVARDVRAENFSYQPLKSEVILPCLEHKTTIFGVGGVFSGAKADHGGAFLAQTAIADCLRLMQIADSANKNGKAKEKVARNREFNMLDLGCGNGLISRVWADVFPNAKIFASDISADAVTSTHLTLLPEILDKRVQISWDNAAHSIPDNEMDFVLLNPPFHKGHEIDATIVQELLEAAKAKLRPNGLLYLVHNSFLRYRPEVEARFTNVVEIQRNEKFTVLRGVRNTVKDVSAV